MDKPRLIFYDSSRVYYSSYYLNGFNELRKSGNLHISISHAIPAQFKSALQNKDWQHLLFTMHLFKYRKGDKECFFCIDTHDSNDIDAHKGSGGYHLPLLQQVDAYFKVNYNPEIIAHTPILKAFDNKIYSISQFFPLKPSLPFSLSHKLALPSKWFGYTPGLSYIQSYDGHLSEAKYRMRDLKNFPTLKQIIAYRKAPKDIDIFYVTSYRHQARHETIMQHRLEVMKKLADIPTLNSVKGFTSYHALPEEYAHVSQRRLSQLEYLETLARSRIVIYTQGIESCISSKFGLAMALGIAAVGEPLANNPQMQTIYPHLKEQFGYTYPDELVNQAIRLINDPEKTRALGNLNAAMFDHYLAPRPTAEYVLQILDKIPLPKISF